MKIHCPPSMQPHVDLIMRGEYEIPYNAARPSIVDVGANIGGFAIWAAFRWKGSEIHCYEPMPDNFEMLQANANLLEKEGTGSRIVANNFAVGDPSHRRMFRGRNNCGESSFFNLGEQSAETVDVETRGPEVLPHGQILKVDTEGCEIEILSGLRGINYDAVLLEYHSEENRRAADRLLADYALVGGFARCLNRGVLKYMHKRCVG